MFQVSSGYLQISKYVDIIFSTFYRYAKLELYLPSYTSSPFVTLSYVFSCFFHFLIRSIPVLLVINLNCIITKGYLSRLLSRQVIMRPLSLCCEPCTQSLVASSLQIPSICVIKYHFILLKILILALQVSDLKFMTQNLDFDVAISIDTCLCT